MYSAAVGKFALIHSKTILKTTVCTLKTINFAKFRQISSKINTFVTRVVFDHLVNFSPKTKSFGAYT